jgi:DNA-binding transcriptional regulator YdaS (Cro superfamily)
MSKLSEYFKANRGKQKELAAALGLRQPTVCKWRRVPITRLAEVEKFTGIPRSQLRPDVFAEISRQANDDFVN